MLDSIAKLASIMSSNKVIRLYAKLLSENDNSKNQVYLGGGFSSLNLLPHSEIKTDSTDMAGSVRDRAKADVRFFWLDEEGLHPAPNAQLILYPKYPEVRMSGFLMGCSKAPSELMRQRLEGRVLFFGVTEDEKIIGYVSAPDAALTKEFLYREFSKTGVFSDMTALLKAGDNSKSELLVKLQEIIETGWIPSQRLSKSGTAKPYRAQNGGGYTLEALLGITPNGFAEPDYLGWEIKQYAVNNLRKNVAKSPVTLITPEPTGGVYTSSGVEPFIRRYGYPDTKGRSSRLNFGGIYKNGADFHHRTGLALTIEGYDQVKQTIVDMNGQLTLEDRNGEIAAAWSFAKLINHWKTKHAKAAYIPSIKRASTIEYRFGPEITLYEGTDFLTFLKHLSAGDIYLDPGLNLQTDKAEKPKTKRRNQFRVKHTKLSNLYNSCENINLDII